MIENYAIRWLLKALVPLLAIPLVFLFQQAGLGRLKRLRPVLAVLLIVLAVWGVLAYFEFGYVRYGRYINPHDVFHYYMGAKYSREVDYADLYRCALVADMEGKKVYRQPNIRNLDTHGYEPVKPVLQNAQKYKSTFSAARWDEFKKDIRYFQSIMPAAKWNQVLGDKGYNATPVWNAVARFLTNRTPTDSWWGMNALVLIDPVLLIGMFAAVWWAFGWRVMLFGIVFYGSNFMMSFVHIKGAFLRLDWVVCLVVSACLLKKNHYKTAGVLMAYSAMARVFPAIFLFGLGVKALFRSFGYADEVLRAGRWVAPTASDRRYIAFFLALAIASAVFVGLATWDDGGPQRWQSFSKKIAVHNNDISTTRVGFKYIFLSPYKQFEEKARAFQQHHTLWQVLMAGLLLLAAFPARRLEDYETIPYGFVPAFFLAAPTFYYYVMLIVPFFLFAPKIERTPRAVGLAGMFVSCFAWYLLSRYLPLEFKLCFLLSCFLQGLVVYMMAVAFWSREQAVLAPVGATLPERPPEDATVSVASAALPATGKRERKSKRKHTTATKAQDSFSRPLEPQTVLSRPAHGFRRNKAVWVGAPLAIAIAVTLVAAGFAFRSRSTPTTGAASANDAQLVFVGDVMLSRNVAASVQRHNNDYSFPFQRAAQYTQAADLAFCNLECPVTERGDLVSKNYQFRAAPQSVAGLTYAGFDVVSVANNHVLDYGPAGLEDTLEVLAKNQIASVGLCDQDGPQRPAIFESKGVRVGFLAYADPRPTYAYAKEFLKFPVRPAKGEKDTIQRDIAQLKPQVDIVVVSIHWGTEYQTEPDPWQQELGRFIIDSGANIVAGHHPHVLQDPKLYHGGLIIYSMGNFVFDQHTRPPTRLSRLYRAYVNKTGLVRAEYLPLEITNQDWQPTPKSANFVPVTASPIPPPSDNG